MNNFWYSLQSFFEFTFSFMNYQFGNVVNLFFIICMTVLTFYWIREMKRNPEKR